MAASFRFRASNGFAYFSARVALERLVSDAPLLTQLYLTVNMGDNFVLATLAPLTYLRELDVRYNRTPAHPLTPRNVVALQRLGQLRRQNCLPL
jgi:hypothetical protein